MNVVRISEALQQKRTLEMFKPASKCRYICCLIEGECCGCCKPDEKPCHIEACNRLAK